MISSPGVHTPLDGSSFALDLSRYRRKGCNRFERETTMRARVACPPLASRLPYRQVSRMPSSDTLTLLEAALSSGDLGRVQQLLDSGVKLNRRLPGGRTALSEAAASLNWLAREPIVAALLKSGADPNERDTDSKTPLMTAAISGCGSLVAARCRWRTSRDRGRRRCFSALVCRQLQAGPHITWSSDTGALSSSMCSGDDWRTAGPSPVEKAYPPVCNDLPDITLRESSPETCNLALELQCNRGTFEVRRRSGTHFGTNGPRSPADTPATLLE